MPMPFLSEKSPTLASVNRCLILLQGVDDSGVAIHSHRLVFSASLSLPFQITESTKPGEEKDMLRILQQL